MKFVSLLAMLGCALLVSGCERQGTYRILDMKAKELADVQAKNLSGAENWGRWTDGSPVSFKFTNGLPSDFRLIVSLRGSFGPNTGKSVEVQVGAQKQSLIAPAGSATRQLDFAHLAGGTDTILFTIPEPTSPKDLGQSEDKRKLGLGLISLEIAPLK